MLVIQRLRFVRRLPLLMILGLVVMAAGGVMDVVVHLAPVAHHGHEGFGEHAAHLVGIAGMVLVLAGVVINGVRRQRRPRAVSHGGRDSNAHR